MMNRTWSLVVIAAFAAHSAAQIQIFPVGPRARPQANAEKEKPQDDAKSLADAKLSADDPAGLIGYFKGRTLSNEDLSKIQAVIARLGDENFEVRLQASEEALTFGPAAIGPLRTAATSAADPEIRWRALEALRGIEKVSHAAVASAAARALAASKHPDAATALLGFLPMADNAAVDEDIRLALKALALRDGELEPALVRGVADANSVRRAAAAVALIEATLKDRVVPGNVLSVVDPILRDERNADTRFRVGFVLASETSSEAAVKALIQALPDLPRGQLWQVEDLLLQLAGEKPPDIKLNENRASLESSRDQWLAWLAENRKPEDYSSFVYKPKTTGRLLMMWQDANWGNGRVVELGADMAQRFRLLGIMAPADIRSLPNGNIEVLEHNYSRVSERTPRGNVVRQQQLPGGQPVSIQKLPDDKILIAYRHQVVICNDKWKELHRWNRNQHDCLAAASLGDGAIYAMVQNPGSLVRLDGELKEQPGTVKIGSPYYQAKLELLPNDRALVTEQNRVAEYDLKEGKMVWKFDTANPSCVQRLSNGNTLVCDFQIRNVREVSPGGEVLWTFTPPDGLQPLRAYRQ